MKKSFMFVLSLLAVVLLVGGCVAIPNKKNEDAVKFKEEYESNNGKKNSNDQEYREISIDEKNPFVYSTPKEIVEKINKGETFYVYFGDNQCPWCRSVIEKFVETANKNKINKVYYVKIWSGDHEEVVRDKYSVDEEGNINLVSKGDDHYQDLLKSFDSLLSNYTLSYVDKKGKSQTVEVGEKRIFAPNFIYVEKGEAKKLVSGMSSLQKDSREELTEEMLKEEEEDFNEFFKH